MFLLGRATKRARRCAAADRERSPAIERAAKIAFNGLAKETIRSIITSKRRSVMLSRKLLSMVSLACLAAPASAQDRVSLAVRNWVTSVVTVVSQASRQIDPRPWGKGQTVQIRVRVSGDGTVLDVTIERPTVDALTEKRVREVVIAAGPFKRPPAEMLAANGSTELSFPVEADAR